MCVIRHRLRGGVIGPFNSVDAAERYAATLGWHIEHYEVLQMYKPVR